MEVGSTSDSQELSNLLQKIWEIKGPRVVKMFLWKACNNILPDKENLFKRKCVNDPLCVICGLQVESVGHVLWSSASAKDVWLECCRRIQKSTSDEDDFLNIFEKLMGKLETEEVSFMACVARQVWLRRNKVVFGEELQSPSKVIQLATVQMEAFTEAEIRRSRGLTPTAVAEVTTWSRPPEGYLKCNWDASLDAERKIMGVGIIVRNHEGSVRAMKCMARPFINDPSTAEAIAAWAAVDMCGQLQFTKVVLEGDSMELVKALRNDDVCWNRYGHLIQDAQIFQRLTEWKVVHVRRSANTEAHKPAKMALSSSEEHLISSRFPFLIPRLSHPKKKKKKKNRENTN
jgi:ribonuclease HI